METSSSNILVGTYSLCAVVLAVIFSLWLAGSEGDYDEYDIIFNERVSGLSVGGGVRFNGITVGEVRELKLAPNNPEQVIARVRVTKDTPVKTDTQAELELVGVTGLAIIQFTGGSPGAVLLKDQSRKKAPQIVAKQSAIADILDGGGEIIAGAQRLLNQENTDALTAILNDIEVLTDRMSKREEDIDILVDNMVTISSDVAEFSESLNQTSENLETLIIAMEDVFNVQVPQSIKEFDIAVADSQLLMTQLNTLMENNSDALDSFMQQGLSETTGAIADSRRLMRTMDSILREIERDPTRFFFGETRPEAVQN